MINFKKYILISFLYFSFFFNFGCYSNNFNNGNSNIITTNSIIDYHYDLYLSSTNSQNDDIAEILKQFCIMNIKNPPLRWKDVKVRYNEYVIYLNLNEISKNYNVFASEEEIYISSQFLEDLLVYYESKRYNVADIGRHISKASTALIVKMNDYEYENNPER
jgi:hypothetical protein